MKTKKKTIFVGGLKRFPDPPKSVDLKRGNGILKFGDNFKPYKSSMEDGTFEETYKGMILDRLVLMDCRLDKINEQLVALRNKDAEVIDLDNAVTDGTNGIGVDDSEEVEFSKQELEDMKTITEAEIIRQRSYGFKTDAPGLLTIKSKLNKMLKDKGEE